MSHHPSRRFGLFAVVGLLGLQLSGLTSSVDVSAAGSLTVDGSCTLADAITAANTDAAVGSCPAGSGADTITLAVDVALTEALPRVASSITIEGAGHVIERADEAPEFRILEVYEAVLGLNDVTVANGVTTGGGEAGGGGAISASFASVSITDSTIRDNTASFGGAIAILDVGLRVTRSTISGNDASGSGGGIDVRTTGASGSLTITESTISHNTARAGGGISAGGGASLNISNSTISGNGMPADVVGTRGGGLALSSVRGTIINTTIADNTAEFGGGIATPEPEPWYDDPNYVPTMTGSILSNPVGGNCDEGEVSWNGRPYVFRAARSGGHNLVSSVDDCSLDDPTDILGGTADLGPLQDNGGPTETQALGPASQALDAIPEPACTITEDQRGTPRPQGSGCDIGSVEMAQAPILTCGDVGGTAEELAAAGYNVVVGTDGADFLPGTPGDDFIIGLDGKDVILAGMGDDVVCAGPSHDVVVGGGGSDTLYGEGGNDRVWGGTHDDHITGGTGKDLLVGGDGDDDISGDGADDTIRGGYGDDVLRGGSGKDDIRGDAGNDMLFGDDHDDILRGHAGTDVCDGGAHIQGDQAFTCETVIDIP